MDALNGWRLQCLMSNIVYIPQEVLVILDFFVDQFSHVVSSFVRFFIHLFFVTSLFPSRLYLRILVFILLKLFALFELTFVMQVMKLSCCNLLITFSFF